MNTDALIAKIGEGNAIAVAEWLESIADEFNQARPKQEDTAEFLEYLSEHLRLTATEDTQHSSHPTDANHSVQR